MKIDIITTTQVKKIVKAVIGNKLEYVYEELNALRDRVMHLEEEIRILQSRKKDFVDKF